MALNKEKTHVYYAVVRERDDTLLYFGNVPSEPLTIFTKQKDALLCQRSAPKGSVIKKVNIFYDQTEK